VRKSCTSNSCSECGHFYINSCVIQLGGVFVLKTINLINKVVALYYCRARFSVLKNCPGHYYLHVQ